MTVGPIAGLAPVRGRLRWSGVELARFKRVSRISLIALSLTAIIVLVTIGSWLELWDLVIAGWGSDYAFFVDVAGRWMATGQFYQAHQLAGPYEAAINVDTLYPPIALFLFLPFLWLPAFLWWAIPLGIIGWSVVRHRPSMWVWPFLALMVWWPRTQSIIVWGSTGMWIAAFLALAIRYRWLGALVLLKPSLAPLALVGIRSRGWWVAAAAMAAVSLPMLPDYIVAMRNNVGAFPGLTYSVQDIPFIALPVIAWMARTERREPTGSRLRRQRSPVDIGRPPLAVASSIRALAPMTVMRMMRASPDGEREAR